ncbi:23S rRNA (uracil(1939)-C(5))-methyltransferase RlmD [Thiohalomonas denitrificans]|uniref:23S rRNA (uracil(1939)-C(5))-methyltransferase RlmD n=1 Tax=Thiohalomonas denitrificans TaxID=415747 RepID=UPI0026F1A2A5|nr:23S rRNA (uracil(1939)-C(5))-methyltransferase RlmD [Thiohalomonas denitrificans]
MARRRHKKLPTEPAQATIESMSHDGRGVAHVEDKAVFIDGALPGETVLFLYTDRRRKFDEGTTSEVIEASPHRVEPRCAHFGLCGGCSLQHLEPVEQIHAKQQILLDNFHHLGKVKPDEVLEPLTGPLWGYRRKARLGVKYVIKKQKLLVGFREKHSPYIAQLSRCEVLHPSVGERLTDLAELIAGLEAYNRIAQIEVAVDDSQTALVLRNLDELSAADQEKLIAFAHTNDLRLFLQPKGPDSVTPLWPESIQLHYALPAHGVDYHFRPTDFTQVNSDINRAMVERALELLAPQADERVIDLFCGLGNFTLPIARRAQAVVGIEGDPGLIERARENAERNGIENATFHTADLMADPGEVPWWREAFDKVLLDPPRSGAQETLPHIARLGIKRLVYISCNPATLARDAGILVNEYGYRLEKAGVMDMFPHTAHVESIALFTKG